MSGVLFLGHFPDTPLSRLLVIGVIDSFGNDCVGLVFFLRAANHF
jgi:hypothetical protein